jgi:hypothetical protein
MKMVLSVLHILYVICATLKSGTNKVRQRLVVRKYRMIFAHLMIPHIWHGFFRLVVSSPFRGKSFLSLEAY